MDLCVYNMTFHPVTSTASRPGPSTSEYEAKMRPHWRRARRCWGSSSARWIPADLSFLQPHIFSSRLSDWVRDCAFDLSFRACNERELSIAASEGGSDRSEADDLTKPAIMQAWAPSCIFMNWCSSHGNNPQRCGIGSMLSLLQEGLDRSLSVSTLKVYMATIAANHNTVDCRSIRKHDLVIRFLGGIRRLILKGCASSPLGISQWSFRPYTEIRLSPFSQLDLVPSFRPAVSHVILRPWPGYVPKVLTTSFRDQVVTLQAIPSQKGDPDLSLLCICMYLECTQKFRRSE